jgi:hypothetical protein
MTADDFKRQVCDVIELYTDNPDHFFERHKRLILDIARRWGTAVFLGALETCCANASFPYFFSGDTEKWKKAYSASQARRRKERNHAARRERLFGSSRGLTIELVPEVPARSREERVQVEKFLRNLKEACQTGKILELAGAPPRFY